jgi:hypothetical protein
MPLRNLHTGSPLLVPSRASTPTTTSLRLGTRALTRVSRCVRPTSANHSSSSTCTRALGSRPCLVRLGLFKAVRCDRRVRRFTTCWTRFGGSRGNEERCSLSRAAGFCPESSTSRSVHDFASDIPSPSGARFRLCRTACVGSVGSRPLPPPPVKVTAFSRSEMSSSDSSPRFARSSLPVVSFDADEVVHHLLAARSAFRHANGNDERDSDSAT